MATAVQSNLRADAAQRNASDWCSAVDRVEKALKSRAQREIPSHVPASIGNKANISFPDLHVHAL